MDWSANFGIDIPTRIRFGWGARTQLDALLTELAARSILVVVSPGLRALPLIAQLVEGLGAVRSVSVFTDVRPNPRVSDVQACCARFAGAGIDHIVGIGGGSAMDQAKATAMAMSLGADLADLIGSKDPLPRRSIGLTLLPTTSGTGAEVSWGAIVSHVAIGQKTGLRGRNIAADHAIVDPELTVSAPLGVTLVTGFDVLTHALESFLSRVASVYTAGLSRQAIGIVFEHLPTLQADLQDSQARSALAYASMLMGINLGQASTCLPHRLQYPLGAATDTSHAEGLSALYPAWLRSTLPHAGDKLAECATWVGVSGGGAGFVDALLELRAGLGLQRNLAGLGVDEAMALRFVDEVSGNLANDPGDHSRDAIRRIYLQSLNGS